MKTYTEARAMKQYTIEITVDGKRRYEVWPGIDPSDAKNEACKALHWAYGNGRWLVGRATEATEAEIEMDRRLTDLLLARLEQQRP